MQISYQNNPNQRELPAGPWDDEPDKLQWREEQSGYDCLAVRSPLGVWCGYVAVTPSHPAYRLHYDRVDVTVHGGLTFADECMEDNRPQAERVCHVSAYPDIKVWWLGFDCGHFLDLVPGMIGMNDLERGDARYRDVAYVKAETIRLAWQLRELELAADEQ